MKILHAHLSREFAGSERYCASLASAQAENGDEVRVIVRESEMVGRWRRECVGAEVLVVPKWVPSFLQGWVAGRFIKGFEPDIVHTHLGRADERVGPAARKQGVPWVTTVHLRWKKDMRKADGVICIAKWQKPDLVQAGYTGPVRVVWNWLPKLETAASAEVAELRRSWGCSEQTVVFGSIGRLHGQKGMDVLVKAFREAFPDPGTDVKLVIVGVGPERLHIQGVMGPEKRVVLSGYQPSVAKFYEAFDAYVSASRYEPFGLTILEAMAHGCQLVCTRTEGPSEFLQEASGQGHVLWAERGNVSSLAAVLNVAKVQGRNRIAYDLTPFAPGRAVKEIAELYDEVRKR